MPTHSQSLGTNGPLLPAQPSSESIVQPNLVTHSERALTGVSARANEAQLANGAEVGSVVCKESHDCATIEPQRPLQAVSEPASRPKVPGGQSFEKGSESEFAKGRQRLKQKVLEWCRSGPAMGKIMSSEGFAARRLDELRGEMRSAVVDQPEAVLGEQHLREAYAEAEALLSMSGAKHE
eukprot:scaffold526045_cov41-Prasinocladus_malaysianus.AAC.1